MNHNVIPILEPITVRPVVVRWDARVIREQNAEIARYYERLEQIEEHMRLARKEHVDALLLITSLDVERMLIQDKLKELV